MSRSSSKISRGNTSDLVGMFNNMSVDEQQDPNHLTPRGASGVSSLGPDTNSSVIRKSSRSLSPSPLQMRLSTSLSSTTPSFHENSKAIIGLNKSTGYLLFAEKIWYTPIVVNYLILLGIELFIQTNSYIFNIWI